jgi:hypothetical protein
MSVQPSARDFAAIESVIRDVQERMTENLTDLMRLQAMLVTCPAVNSVYEELIESILKDNGAAISLSGVHDNMLSRGRRCSKKTTQRYLKHMMRTGLVARNESGYYLAGPHRKA